MDNFLDKGIEIMIALILVFFVLVVVPDFIAEKLQRRKNGK
jgi:uncharacterized protein YqhQ